MFPEEEINNNNNNNNENDVSDYIETIKALKANSVSRDKYDDVLAQNKKLLNALASGQQIAIEQPKIATDEEVEKMREDLFKLNNSMTNLEYITKALDLRDAIMSKGERDPFLPLNKDYVPSERDQEMIENMVAGLRATIDYCEGDAALFNSELKRLAR